MLQLLLGLRIDLSGFYRLASSDPRLAKVIEECRGLKPPRYLSVFEALVNAIAGQQITLTFAIRLLSRLAIRFGPALEDGENAPHAFPLPQNLASHMRGLRRLLAP